MYTPLTETVLVFLDTAYFNLQVLNLVLNLPIEIATTLSHKKALSNKAHLSDWHGTSKFSKPDTAMYTRPLRYGHGMGRGVIT